MWKATPSPAGEGGIPLYRLMATDIDGTLLNNRLEVTPRTRQAIHALQERGVTLVLSTARPPRTVRTLYQELGLTGPVIAYNGALVYVPGHEDSPLLHRPIPRNVATRAMGIIRGVGAHLNCGLELRDEWHVDYIDERLNARIKADWAAALPKTGNLEAAIAATDRGISKIYVPVSGSLRQTIEQALADGGLADRLTVTSSGPDLVEILAAGVDKGSAIRMLAEHLGIAPHETVALGDGENDIPALQAAGLGIAMANALDAVKRAAAVIAPSNEEDGWADAVERYVLAG